MKEFYWDAKLIDSRENVGGCIFAINENEAIKQLQNYGFYTDIILKEIKNYGGFTK